VNNIKTQLTEMFGKSSDAIKNYYQIKVEKLHAKSESLFVLWSDMEQKYEEQLSKGKSKNKDLLKSLVNERKRYKDQLNSIKQDLQVIMFNVQKKRLHPGFA
jgi:gas vesicle protein